MTGTQTKLICTYCGEREGTTKDHVPLKGLFASPRPNLVTVPCCENCRQHQPLDDEYFLRVVSMKSGIAETPSAKAARDSVIRSLQKPAKVRFTRAFFRSTKDVRVYSPSGIYIGQGMSYDVDLDRLCRVVQRTTRGLFLHEFGRRLPDGHRCKTYAIDGFELKSSKIIAQLQTLWGHAVSGKRHDFGETVFTYWFRPVEGAEAATIWAFLVYGSVGFLTLTGPKANSYPSILETEGKLPL